MGIRNNRSSSKKTRSSIGKKNKNKLREKDKKVVKVVKEIKKARVKSLRD